MIEKVSHSHANMWAQTRGCVPDVQALSNLKSTKESSGRLARASGQQVQLTGFVFEKPLWAKLRTDILGSS